MKKPFPSTLALALVLSSTEAFAGGPVVIVDAPEVVARKSASSVGILPLLLIGIVFCVALCGGDEDGDDRTATTGPGGKLPPVT